MDQAGEGSFEILGKSFAECSSVRQLALDSKPLAKILRPEKGWGRLRAILRKRVVEEGGLEEYFKASPECVQTVGKIALVSRCW